MAKEAFERQLAKDLGIPFEGYQRTKKQNEERLARNKAEEAKANAPPATKAPPGDDDEIDDEDLAPPAKPTPPSKAKAARARMAKAVAELQACAAECAALLDDGDEGGDTTAHKLARLAQGR